MYLLVPQDRSPHTNLLTYERKFAYPRTFGLRPCQYHGSKYPEQNNKVINSLTNHPGDHSLLTTGTKIKIS